MKPFTLCGKARHSKQLGISEKKLAVQPERLLRFKIKRDKLTCSIRRTNVFHCVYIMNKFESSKYLIK